MSSLNRTNDRPDLGGGKLSRPVVGFCTGVIGAVAGTVAGSAVGAAIASLLLAEWLGSHLRHDYPKRHVPFPGTLGFVAATIAAAFALIRTRASGGHVEPVDWATLAAAAIGLALVAAREARRFRRPPAVEDDS